MSPREKRILQNEGLFRAVNERIAELEDDLFPDEPLPLICECANTGCTTVINVDPGTFGAVRENARLFLVAPGHERDDETAVGQGTGYLIVEKRDEI